MKFNKDTFQQSIGDSWENNMEDVLDTIDRFSQERYPVSPYILELLHITAKESYLAAIKTMEEAVISSFEDCDPSDTYPQES